MAKKFSKKVEYNGIIFDSTLEFKFALLIEDLCEYYYHPLYIWYDRTDLDKKGKQACPHKYEPDFLVRKITDNSCYMIEIKNSRSLHDKDTRNKKFIAERYIKEKGYDWKYKILTEKDFELPENKRQTYDEICEKRHLVYSKKRIENQHNKFAKEYFRKNKVPFKSHYHLDEKDHILFVKKGILREVV